MRAPGDVEVVKIDFPDDNVGGEFDVIRMGTNRLQMWGSQNCLLESVEFGDVIEVEEVGDQYLFKRVAESGNYILYTYTAPRIKVESEEFYPFMEGIVGDDGHWEFLMRGFLLVFIPGSRQYDPSPEILAFFPEEDSEAG